MEIKHLKSNAVCNRRYRLMMFNSVIVYNICYLLCYFPSTEMSSLHIVYGRKSLERNLSPTNTPNTLFLYFIFARFLVTVTYISFLYKSLLSKPPSSLSFWSSTLNWWDEMGQWLQSNFITSLILVFVTIQRGMLRANI